MFDPRRLTVGPIALAIDCAFLAALALGWYLAYEAVRFAGRSILPALLGG